MFAYTVLEIIKITLIVCRFGAKMREDISSLVSSMLHSNIANDLNRILTNENIFDASVLRSFILDTVHDREDADEFFDDMKLDESFIRGFMAGLIQCLLIQRSRNEVMGRPSHADILQLYDASSAYIMESKL